MTHTHATPLCVLDRTPLTNQLLEVGWEFTLYFFFSKFCHTFNAHLLASILYTKLASAPPAQGLEPWGQVWL